MIAWREVSTLLCTDGRLKGKIIHVIVVHVENKKIKSIYFIAHLWYFAVMTLIGTAITNEQMLSS